MSFGAPSALLWLILAPALGFLMWNGDRSVRKRLRQLLAPDLQATLVDSTANWLTTLRRASLLCAFVFFIFAMARPQWGVIQEKVALRGRDIMIAVDTSRSMLAVDASPTRLGRAKLVAEDLIAALPNERIGLIAFAGDAEVVAPLTVDHDTVLDTLNGLDTATVPRGGTNIASAIRVARLGLGQREKSFRALVLLTDGEDLAGEGLAAAREASKAGIRIFAAGIGSPAGSEILLPDGQALRDEEGKVVISHLGERSLRSIAQSTGGSYLHITATIASRAISQRILALGESSGARQALMKPIERYQWPLSIGLLFLLVSLAAADRLKNVRLPVKGAAVTLLLGLALQTPSHAESAIDAFRSGDYEGALEKWQEQLKSNPHDPRINLDAGNAEYRLDRFQDAFENYSEAMQSPDPKLRENAYYDGGNALFKAGDNEEDIERQLTNYYDAKYLYEQALDLDPKDAAARKNLQLLLERINQTEKQKKAAQQQQGARQQSGRKQQGQGQQSDEDQPGASRPGQSDDKSRSNNSRGRDRAGSAPTPGKKKQGDLQEMPPRDSNRENGQDEQPPGQTKMSRDEAMQLLDSLKGEEDHVPLMGRGKSEGPVSRDW